MGVPRHRSPRGLGIMRKLVVWGIAALCTAGCALNGSTVWVIRSPQEAVNFAQTICGDAVKSHPGQWRAVQRRDGIWMVSSADEALNVWVIPMSPQESACRDAAHRDRPDLGLHWTQ